MNPTMESIQCILDESCELERVEHRGTHVRRWSLSHGSILWNDRVEQTCLHNRIEHTSIHLAGLRPSLIVSSIFEQNLVWWWWWCRMWGGQFVTPCFIPPSKHVEAVGANPRTTANVRATPRCQRSLHTLWSRSRRWAACWKRVRLIRVSENG